MPLFLGVDPGLRRTGLGLVSYDGKKLKLEGYKLITPSTKAALPERLKELVNGTGEFISNHPLHSAAIENLFHSVNAKSTLLIGQTRGAIIASLIMSGIEVFEYTALQIKQTVTGYGKAEKEQVKKMTEIQLGVKLENQTLDISDALACAICHAVSIRGILP
jgi:crossover junction endodeoxyribonuclease RuvC